MDNITLGFRIDLLKFNENALRLIENLEFLMKKMRNSHLIFQCFKEKINRCNLGSIKKKTNIRNQSE